jgi:hypothetical protein
MTQPLAFPDPLLVTIVLGTLAIGLPILFVLAIRFLLDRNLSLGRSKELEKLIWQLHRIASAMEHQMNLSFPAVQPGTEEARDIAFLQEIPPQPKAATPGVASTAASATNPAVQQPPTAPAAPQQPAAPQLVLRDPSSEVPRAGVNSMFDL